MTPLLQLNGITKVFPGVRALENVQLELWPGKVTSRLGSTRPTIAVGWELAVVTMAVLGGVNILGGSGSMVGVIIAAFLMGLVTFGLSLLNVPGIVMSVIIGTMLIVVISLPIITRRIMQRRRM